MVNAFKNIRDLVKQVNHSFMELISLELTEYGITVPQWLVIRCLRHGARKMSDISRMVNLTNSTVTGIVDRLERSGYVKRCRDQEDRRIVYVHPTKKLEDYMQSIPVLQDDYVDSIFGEIPEEEAKAIIASLHVLIRHLQEQKRKRHG